MISEADRSGEGGICKNDFYRIMKKKSGNPLDEIESDEDD